jgi:hypothetical protein
VSAQKIAHFAGQAGPEALIHILPADLIRIALAIPAAC